MAYITASTDLTTSTNTRALNSCALADPVLYGATRDFEESSNLADRPSSAHFKQSSELLLARIAGPSSFLSLLIN